MKAKFNKSDGLYPHGLSVEELLKPRYKVIAKWPSMRDFSLNQIVVLNEPFSPQYMKYVVEDCSGKREYITKYFDDYPHLFEKLNWYEEIEFRDLPKYIKWIDPSDKMHVEYFEVENWASSPNKNGICRCYVKDGTLFIGDCLPATEEEYLEHQKPNKI
jgi:hypothetical protein